MTLKSAVQDLRDTTLAAVRGLLGKFVYLASLRGSRGRYEHWGMETVHGVEAAERALRSAHAEVLTGILRTPLEALEEDLEESVQGSGLTRRVYVERLRRRGQNLLPGERKDSPSAAHFNSVLVALSSLERNRGRATRSTS
jgi:hypothetical protein